jgi:hypothetical protein
VIGLGMEQYPELASIAINRAEILGATGKDQPEAVRADRLDAGAVGGERLARRDRLVETPQR